VASGEGALAAYRDAIRLACEMAAKDGREITIEPINACDIPGYLLNDFGLAEKLIGALKLPNLKLQFDIYHRQRIHGEVMEGLAALLAITGHIQIAAAPLRQEPMTGEVDDRLVLKTIERLGYSGFIGCEYRPAAGTVAGLAWMKAL
jgi:hydroxypyruvate isomerase